jgi:hypothetical protein
MRGLLRAVAVFALTAGALSAMASQNTSSAWADIQDGPGIGWQYSETAHSYWRPPAGTPTPGNDGPSGPPLVYTQTNGTNEVQCPDGDPAFACDGPPAYITGMLCGSALRGPRGLPLFAWIRYERTIGPNGQPTLWVGREAGCDEPGEDDVVPMQEISDTINAEVFQPVGEPKFEIWPRNNKTLVGLPTVLATEYPEGDSPIPANLLVSVDPTKVRIPIHIPRPGGGLDGFVEATATYNWKWNGGSAVGRGKPYVAGTDPATGGYTTAKFQHIGTQRITLTATWEGQALVAGLDPEDIVPVEISSFQDLQVQQAKSVITR